MSESVAKSVVAAKEEVVDEEFGEDDPVKVAEVTAVVVKAKRGRGRPKKGTKGRGRPKKQKIEGEEDGDATVVTAKEEVAKEEVAKEEVAKEEVAKEEVAKEEVAKEEVTAAVVKAKTGRGRPKKGAKGKAKC